MNKLTDWDQKLLIRNLIELLYNFQKISIDYDNFFIMNCNEHQKLGNNEVINKYELMNYINWINIKNVQEHLELDFDSDITQDDEIEVIFTFPVICKGCYRKIEITNQKKYFTGFVIDEVLSYEDQEKQIIDQLEQKIKKREIILDEWIEY
ncbi:hypothetical protein I7636_02335 [Mycoplasma mycoides subsp. capri]|uniref:hypothetical protein n=1 Tax=Mycoplasma mycoides TaxID=2102 RepID=UPI0022408B32|nr:hypothetical protein [Mycoplasma mycoides]QVK01573.1 hypothetical protein I7636_02335 [Mycoplasma mycoides subsp. capri]